MRIINEVDFREYKKLVIGLTHEMEGAKEKFENIIELKENFIKSKLDMSEEQINEIKEYENRLQSCIDYFSEY